MKKTVLLFMLMWLCGMTLMAAPVSRQQAQQIAAQFLSGKSTSHRALSASEMQAEVVFNKVNGMGMPYLYAVHASGGRGYVIVSGDDCAPAILGYVEHGNYDEAQMPENMRSWLQHYADEIELLQRYNLTTPRRTATNAGDPIARTLNSKWDQFAPFNLECPMATSYLDEGLTKVRHEAEQTVTGCAATAMAQVLYLWKNEYAKPETKEAKLAYDIPARTDVVYQSAEEVDDQMIPIWVKFSDEAIPASTTIDWENLKDVYTHRDENGKVVKDENGNVVVDGTAEQQAAVARLMHICGAAESMYYGPTYAGGSGTGTTQMIYGAYHYLGFPNVRVHSQSNTDEYGDWVQQLYDELKVSKAVLFTGMSSSGGHAFVVDGYDKEDLFHINWGWSGLADESLDNGGFYRLNSLLPTDQGIGGAVINDGFSRDQSFFSGLYPNAPAPEGEVPMMTTGKVSTQQTGTDVSDGNLSLYIYFSCTNNVLPELKAQIGLCLENEAGDKDIVPVGDGLSSYLMGELKGYDSRFTWTGVTDGNYKIRMYFRTSLADDAWTLCQNVDNSYIRIEVNNGQAVVHNSGRFEVDVLGNDLKKEYIQREDVNFNVQYKVTTGSINFVPFVLALPVKPDGSGGFVKDDSRVYAKSSLTPSPVTGDAGYEFTIQGLFAADDLKVGYYQVMIKDLANMLPGEFYFQVTDKEPFKFIFKDTPYVKYADANGIIYMGPNFYCHKFEKLRAFGYTATSFTGSNGKTYLVDNSPDTVLVVKDTLKADVIMTPNYVLNESDFGDATVMPVWDFDKPDSVARFDNYQGKCCFVKPTWFDSNYIDLNMTCDATNGWIDNVRGKQKGYADVGAGTKFTLPARYGTIYRMTTKEALDKTTIADSTSTQYKTTKDAKGNYVATLLYYESDNDSINIVVGEDIRLISISASYPGGDNYMTWMPDTATVKNELVTIQKPDGAGCLLYDVSDLTINGGLNVVAGEPLDSLSAQIEVPDEFDENKYLSVSFQMGEGFSYKHGKAFVSMRLYGTKASTKVKLVMSDTKGNKIESRLYEYNNLADSVLLDTLANLKKPNDIYLEDKVTMKVYVYGDADYYRLYMGIQSSGEVCEILRFPEGYNFVPYKAKSEIDLDGIGLLTVDSYEVVGVDDENDHIILNAIEEVPMGDVLVIHSDEAGATHHIPLTRADDAYVRGNNKLWVSDGTVRGGKDIYRFAKEGELYVFRNSSSDVVLPRGEIYLKYHSAYKKEVYYLSEQDVPEKITELLFYSKEDNTPTISQYKGRTIKKVTLDGFTFFKNHMWNTLCVPFDIIGDAIETTPLQGAEIWELDVTNKADYEAPTGFDTEAGVVTLNFKPVHSIEPGKPYFLEWKTTTASQIDNPVFENVTLKTSEDAEMRTTSSDGKVQIVGTYAPELLAGGSAANLYVGTNDKIHIPVENHEVDAFNAYFLIDLGNGLGKPGTDTLQKIVMNIADEDNVLRVITITVPASLKDGVWYDLQGRKYTDKPTQHGIYIMNGKKILIK